MDKLTIYIDAVSKGNPGQAGCGILIYKEGSLLKKLSIAIGITTNNVAEYFAFIFGMIEGLNFKVKDIVVYTDSLLLVKQLKGEYRVKDEWLKRLHLIAQKLIKCYNKFEVIHIPRQDNKDADKLANLSVSPH